MSAVRLFVDDDAAVEIAEFYPLETTVPQVIVNLAGSVLHAVGAHLDDEDLGRAGGAGDQKQQQHHDDECQHISHWAHRAHTSAGPSIVSGPSNTCC